MSALSPWIDRGTILTRVTSDGASAGIVFKGGGWYAGNAAGESRGGGRNPIPEEEAKRECDAALLVLGHTIEGTP